MVNFSSTLSNQIRFLLQSLSDTNTDYVFRELCKFIELGTEGSTLVLQTCVDHLNCRGTGSRDLKNMQLDPVFGSLFKFILNKSNFSTIFCQSIDSATISEGFLESLSNALNLSASEKIGIGLALSDSENSDLRMCGNNFCLSKIEELCVNPISINSAEQIPSIIMFLRQSEGLTKHIDSFMHMLSLVPLKEGTQLILAPLLSDELRGANFVRNLDFFSDCSDDDFDAILAEMEKERNMNDIIRELGYGCTVNSSQCKEVLSLLLPLTEVTIARMLGTIACTHSGLEDQENAFLALHLALGSNILSDQPSLSSWNIDIIIDSIKQLVPGINWIGVFENMDHEGFYVPNEEAFSFLMSIYRRACQDPFPLHAISGFVWKNTEGQLSFLKYAVSAPPEVFTFAHSVRQLGYMDVVHGHKFQLGLANHAWLCLDLLNVLCQLAERGHVRSVQSILEYPLEHCPEVLLLGMADVNTAYNLIQYEVLSSVFPVVIGNATAGGMILHLWHVNPNLVLRGFSEAHNVNPENVARILNICQEIQILSAVLEMIPSPFGIRLAALASRDELIDLEKWLKDNLSTYKDIFYEECLKFLKEMHFIPQIHHVSANPSSHSDAPANLYSETSSTFLKVLQAQTNIITASRVSEEMERLHKTLVHVDSNLENEVATDSSMSGGYADDIEAEANSYFRQMFSGQLTIDAMVQLLARFKESSEKREKSIFDCIIANLFEEYRFFPKYPETQLKIAAVLFGSIIKHQLVTHLTLGIALRGVLDALRKPPDSRMFVFGTKALEQFLDRLIEWPQYCNHILQISHLRGTHSELVLFIEQSLARISSGHSESHGGNNASVDPNHSCNLLNYEMHGSSLQSIGSGITQPGQQLSSPPQLQHKHQSSLDERHINSANRSNHMKQLLSPAEQPSVVPSGDSASVQKSQNSVSAQGTLSSSPSFVRPSRGVASSMVRPHSSNTGFGSALNIETLVAAAEKRETPIEAPASEIQDKLSFIINNISTANIDAKAKEFAEIMKEQYYPWFAQYMVMKRASIEPNFHELYLKFIDKVNSKALNKEIVQASYENCKVLLGSELIKSSSEERSLLKNLGSWLGKFTIGRNQVLRAREIDPKSLITEAYEKGWMIAVIPFTSKILEACQNSLAYQPPNPWTMGILGLLAEIYAMPNLKMNLKFDIEVLFKNLGVDMKDVMPTYLLKDRKRAIDGNPDFSNKDLGAPQPHVVAEVKSGPVFATNQIELPLELTSPSLFGVHTHMSSQREAPRHLPSGTLTEDEKLTALGLTDQLSSAQGLVQATSSHSPLSASQLPTPIPNIGTHVIINPKLSSLGLHMHFQRVVPIAMDRAIKEVVTGIVQRSVSIATQTTKELVLKDYAMESDETRIYNAAHLMVASLAGSLAHVTCKEPLRGCISSQLRNTLQGLNIASELLGQAVLLVTNDNLDLGCALIEQAATDKAIQTIDGEIAQQLSLRRNPGEAGAPTFFYSNIYAQSSMGVALEAFRPKPGGVSFTQHRVYEDFVRFPWQTQPSQSSTATPASPSALSGSAGLSHLHGLQPGQHNPGVLSSGLENTGSQPMEFVSKEMDSSSSLLVRASSTHIGASNGAIQHGSEKNPTVSSSSSAASAPEESRASTQPVPSTSAADHFGSIISEPLLNTRDALDRYQIVAQKLETSVGSNATEADIQDVIAEVPEILLKCISRDEAALAMAQKVFKALYENASSSLRVGTHLAMLASICDVCKLVVKELTSWVIYSDEECKFNVDIIMGLIRRALLNLAEYNLHMVKLLDGGRNKAATEFVILLLQTLVIEEPGVISELHNLVDALTKLAMRPGSPESVQQLIEIFRNPAGLTFEKDDKGWLSRDEKASVESAISKGDYSCVDSIEPDSIEPDPAGFREQVSMLFMEWCRICELPGANDTACTQYILQLQQNGLLKGDDMSDRFIHILTELSVAHCLSSDVIISGSLQSHQQVQPLSFLAIDIYSKLVSSILRYSPTDQGSSKLFIMSKVLAVTVRFIQKDAEEKKGSFNPRPYFRLFINWLHDLGSLDHVFDGLSFQVLLTFASSFLALQPLTVPAFSFAWLELVSHRNFMPKLLTGNLQKGWPYIQRLLVSAFQYLEPFLRNAELGEPVHFLYKGTLRVLLVLLHDFPEFLCDYHFTFCDVIPPSCIQMRNIILSAFPRNMKLPDPSTPNLKIDLLAEISQSPRILSEVDAVLKLRQMKTEIDEYLKMRQQGSSFLAELKQRLLLLPGEAARAGTRYNVPLINSLVLYVGMQAIQQLQARTPPHTQSKSNPLVFLGGAALDIFQALIVDLDTEGRYLYLNAVANQLRYPNNHTHYFSFILLYLFADSDQEIIQEQITRVLLERLIANQPHPWGLLITFLELIKNPKYNFWNRSFIRRAPEIEKLFESVSRLIGGPKPANNDPMVSV